MTNTASTAPDPSAFNIKAICKKISKREEKRKNKHSNLYVRATMFLKGAVFTADVKMIDDLEEVLSKDYKALSEYLQNARKQLQSKA